MSTFTFGRMLGSLFGTASPAQPRPDARSSARPAPVVVGQGARNERHVNVAGQAMLFRDEGGVVVQFLPAFDFELKQTAVGMKLMPSLAPHWEVLREHTGTLTDAIATAIREAQPAESDGGSPAPSRKRSELEPRKFRERDDAIVDAVVSVPAPQASEAPSEAPKRPERPERTERPRYGVLKEWGEKEFPDGKRPGKTYESFCITLQHRGGTDVVQGEGLRDAIAEANCRVGDRVEVRRVGKTKVPAVDKRGRPKLDARGAQVLWDKWLWSIKKS
ncbi:hypothetical protein AWB74_07014 [Caballeronia arvi]|uniref:Uncharacterized protein n=1 Tax=Caballeronia arvi TaxID=1777135 RepID=A0A158KW66_9BURK|nr:hypothetical protein [Caballeronia arvi]SAL84661.1 hypothetical protein AWB74_07014 [Caballeronia arvi]